MIKLSVAAQAAYSYLAVPPTHAVVTSANLVCQPWPGGLQFLRVNYQCGTLDVSSNFVLNENVATVVITIPGDVSANQANELVILGNIFGAGTAPTPGAPATPTVVVGKKVGNYKLADLDAAFSFIDPRLAGTVV